VTYPQQYTQPQMPGYPPAPEQPQFPQAPQPQYAPAQGYAPAPGYPAPPQHYGPPQGYPQQYGQPPQPAPQLASGSLDAFYQQPSSGGGAALKFEVGTRYVGVVSRPITNADIQQQTQRGSGLPAFFRDGRPKFVMKVPLQLQPTPDRPDGLGQWYVSGAGRDELVRAMAEAGAPEGPPEAGAVIDVTCTGTRQITGMSPAWVYTVRYQRPNGGQPAVQPVSAAPVPVPATAPPAPAVSYTPVQQPAPPVQAPPQFNGSGQPGGNLSPEQQALLAQLTGQTAVPAS
jgi:hypothetical protein